MKVKNTSSKIIAFGSTTLLPNETGELDDSWENNDVVKMYIDRGMLQRDEAATASPEVTSETAVNSAPEAASNADKATDSKETKSKK